MKVQICSCASRASRGSLERLVDLIADLLAHRVGSGKPLIIAAGVQRRGNVEKRLAVLQADIGTRGIHQCWGMQDLPPPEACESESFARTQPGMPNRDQQRKRGDRQARGKNPGWMAECLL